MPIQPAFIDRSGVITSSDVYPGTDLLQNGDQTLTLTLVDEETYDVLPQDSAATIYIKDNVGELFDFAEVTMVSCLTLSANQRQLTFMPYYLGITGEPINFSVVNELPATTNEGPSTLKLYTDNPVITLKATQSGTEGEATFSYDWLVACNSDVPIQQPPSAPFSITGVTTVSCLTASGGLRQVKFTPGSEGVNG